MIVSTGKVLLNELESPKETTRLGTGWLSGASALLLAVMSLLSVLCLHYPDVLTTREIRSFINLDVFRSLLQLAIIIAFLLASISLILRQNKALSLTAVVLVLIAVVLGGSDAQQRMKLGGDIYLALDWFMLNLILTGLLFLPMERLFRRVEQSVFRLEWREDLFYFMFSSVMVQSLTFLSMLPASTVLAHSDMGTVRSLISSQPLVLQFVEIMFLTDFVQYWLHRMFHQVPFLWRFHAVHHSARAMDWLAGSRMHIVEIVVLRGLTIIPMYVLGFENPAIYAYIILVYLYATYIHANLRFDIEFLKPLIVTPRFHHWHHGLEKEAIDVNFAIHFPIFDRLFGTYYMPEGRWPSGYGIGGHPVPSGFIRQFFYPFKRSKQGSV